MKRTRFEVPCQPGELDAWRLAAGDVPVARWARRVLNEAAAGSERSAAVAAEVGFTGGASLLSGGSMFGPAPERPAFRPDFKEAGGTKKFRDLDHKGGKR